MNTTLSTQQIRLVALAALVAVVGIAYWLVVPRSQSTATRSTVTTTAHTTSGRTTAAPPAKPSVTPAKPTTKPVTTLVTHGLPVKVARALQTHRVVVVALYSPGSQLDELAQAESAAAAKAQGAGFVSLDVFRQKEGNPILHKLGVVDTPAVLVVSRPAHVYAELPGVPDRTVVEQAVADARG